MKRTLIARVEDKPGVLNRVASLFRRRAFNIESLTVGHTEAPGVSRMTIVVDSTRTDAEKVAQNLAKLVNVIRVDDVSEKPAVTRDLALIKVETPDSRTRAELMQIVETFRARVVDVGLETLIVEATGTEDKIDGLLEVLRPFGIVEMVRTGRVAKKLRREGFIPGIFYGPGNESVSITLNPKDLEKVLATEYGSRVLLKLSISGLDRKKRNAMVKDIQINPINYSWTHADLYEVSLKREVEVNVPIKLVGTPPGVKTGGIMEQIRRELTIKALPTNIPSVIELDTSELELGDSIHIDDITAENYTIVADSNFTIAIVSAPEAEEEVAEEEEEVEEETAAAEEEEETRE